MNLSTKVLKMLLSNWSEENLHSNLLKMNGVTIFSLSTHHLRAASTETVRRGRREEFTLYSPGPKKKISACQHQVTWSE